MHYAHIINIHLIFILFNSFWEHLDWMMTYHEDEQVLIYCIYNGDNGDNRNKSFRKTIYSC